MKSLILNCLCRNAIGNVQSNGSCVVAFGRIERVCTSNKLRTWFPATDRKIIIILLRFIRFSFVSTCLHLRMGKINHALACTKHTWFAHITTSHTPTSTDEHKQMLSKIVIFDFLDSRFSIFHETIICWDLITASFVRQTTIAFSSNNFVPIADRIATRMNSHTKICSIFRPGDNVNLSLIRVNYEIIFCYSPFFGITQSISIWCYFCLSFSFQLTQNIDHKRNK